MPATANTNIISYDVTMAIKHYCFNNLTEFYKRYEIELDMSLATFHRTLSGEYSSKSKIARITTIAKNLGLMLSDEEGSEWLVKKNLIIELVKRCDKLSMTPSIQSLGELKVFMEKYRLAILS